MSPDDLYELPGDWFLKTFEEAKKELTDNPRLNLKIYKVTVEECPL